MFYPNNRKFIFDALGSMEQPRIYVLHTRIATDQMASLSDPSAAFP